MAKVMNVNNEKLKEIYKENDVYKAALELFSTRERSARNGVVNFSRIRRELEAHGTKATKDKVVALFKRLQGLSLGKIQNGKGGKPAKFILAANLVSIGEVATGTANEVMTHVSRTRLPNIVKAEPQFIETPIKKSSNEKASLSVSEEQMIIITKGEYRLELSTGASDEVVKKAAHILNNLSIAS